MLGIRFYPLIVVLAFTSSLLRTTAAERQPHEQWEAEIKAFEARDKTNPPPHSPILFIGSSSVRMWKTLADDFKGFPVINRGFGGSQMTDSAYFVDRIVLPYHPRQIYVYAGDNDLAAGKAPEQVLADFKEFVRKVKASVPSTKIAYIAVKPSPSRWQLADKMRATNKLIAEYARFDSNLSFIDVFTPMLDKDGKPAEELFIADKLHMNAKGYALWTSIIRPTLIAQ